MGAAVFLLAVALGALISVFNPQWDIRWLSRSGKGVPMSVRGRVFMTCYFGYMSAVIFIAPVFKSFVISELCIASVLPLIGVGYFFFLRDRDG